MHSTLITRRGTLRALALLFAFATGMGGARAWADGPLDFTLLNRLGTTISEIHMSPHQAGTWEEDLLGSGVLYDDQNENIHFPPEQVERGDVWDLKIVTSEGETFTWVSPGFNLTRISEITLYRQRGEAIASSR